MTRSYEGYDSVWVIYMGDMSHSYAGLIHEFDMTHSYASHDSFIQATCLTHMGQLWLVKSTKLKVSFAKEPYKREDILQK